MKHQKGKYQQVPTFPIGLLGRGNGFICHTGNPIIKKNYGHKGIIKYNCRMNSIKHFAFLALAILPLALLAQKAAPQNWHHLDPAKDKIWGISSDRVYSEIKPAKAQRPVIVAVIDGGTDINHDDLREVLWMNRAEIQDNKLDDDGNGLVDDVFGWNFIGGAEGSVEYDNLEITRISRDYKDLFDGDGTNTGYSESGCSDCRGRSYSSRGSDQTRQG